MLKIYAVDIDGGLKDDEFSLFMKLCDFSKKERILNMKSRHMQEQSLTANALAKYSVKAEFGLPCKKQKIVCENYGKPYLEGEENIYFSISHSGNAVVCAISDKPVGIDIQKKVRFSKKTADFVGLSENCSEDEFFKAWTQAEATAKKTGKPLWRLLKSENQPALSTISFKYKDYYISVAK